jgi:hypothetical protein
LYNSIVLFQFSICHFILHIQKKMKNEKFKNLIIYVRATPLLASF